MPKVKHIRVRKVRTRAQTERSAANFRKWVASENRKEAKKKNKK